MKITTSRIKEIIREELAQASLEESLESDIAAASRDASEDRSGGMIAKWADEALERLRNLEPRDLNIFKQKIRHRGSLAADAVVNIQGLARIEGKDAGFQVTLDDGEVVEFKPVFTGYGSRYRSGAPKGGSRKPRRF